MCRAMCAAAFLGPADPSLIQADLTKLNAVQLRNPEGSFTVEGSVLRLKGDYRAVETISAPFRQR